MRGERREGSKSCSQFGHSISSSLLLDYAEITAILAMCSAAIMTNCPTCIDIISSDRICQFYTDLALMTVQILKKGLLWIFIR